MPIPHPLTIVNIPTGIHFVDVTVWRFDSDPRDGGWFAERSVRVLDDDSLHALLLEAAQPQQAPTIHSVYTAEVHNVARRKESDLASLQAVLVQRSGVEKRRATAEDLKRKRDKIDRELANLEDKS